MTYVPSIAASVGPIRVSMDLCKTPPATLGKNPTL